MWIVAGTSLSKSSRLNDFLPLGVEKVDAFWACGGGAFGVVPAGGRFSRCTILDEAAKSVTATFRILKLNTRRAIGGLPGHFFTHFPVFFRM